MKYLLSAINYRKITRYIVAIFIINGTLLGQIIPPTGVLSVEEAMEQYQAKNDSIDYSILNVHAGVGLYTGSRIGFNMRFSPKISLNIEYGISTHLFLGHLGGPLTVINTGLNYHYRINSGPVLGIIISYGIWNKPDQFSIVLFPSIGYRLYNHKKSVYSLQFNAGYSILIYIDKSGPFDNSGTYIFPNLEIILGIQFNRRK